MGKCSLAAVEFLLQVRRRLDSMEAFPGSSVVKNLLPCGRPGFNPWVRKTKTPWRRNWQPTPIFLPGKSHGQRSLTGYSPWGCKRVAHNFVTE